jgi:membrane protease YdiL (CAAX protease family)
MELESPSASARVANQGGDASNVTDNGAGSAPPRALTWVDALLGLILVEAGTFALIFWLPAPLANSWVLNYAGHAWFLAVPLAWFWLLRRRFPVGRLRWRELRAWAGPWWVVWAFVALLNVALAGATIAQGSGALGAGRHEMLALEPLLADVVFRLILVGLAEEFLFRGLIQTGLNSSLRGTLALGRVRLRVGTVVAAVVFGLTHAENLALGQALPSVLFNLVYAIFLGLVAGYFYDKTRNLWGAVILHNIADFLAFAVPIALVALTGHLQILP